MRHDVTLIMMVLVLCQQECGDDQDRALSPGMEATVPRCRAVFFYDFFSARKVIENGIRMETMFWGKCHLNAKPGLTGKGGGVEGSHTEGSDGFSLSIHASPWEEALKVANSNFPLLQRPQRRVWLVQWHPVGQRGEKEWVSGHVYTSGKGLFLHHQDYKQHIAVFGVGGKPRNLSTVFYHWKSSKVRFPGHSFPVGG